PATDTRTLAVLPLPGGVVLPGMVVNIAAETDEAKAAFDAATADGNELLLVPRVAGRYARVGVIARIESSGALPGGTKAFVVRATTRAWVGTGVLDASSP